MTFTIVNSESLETALQLVVCNQYPFPLLSNYDGIPDLGQHMVVKIYDYISQPPLHPGDHVTKCWPMEIQAKARMWLLTEAPLLSA